MKEDYEKYRSDILIKAAENKKSLKKAERNASLKSPILSNLMNERGEIVSNRKHTEYLVKGFYNGLFKSHSVDQKNQLVNRPLK